MGRFAFKSGWVGIAMLSGALIYAHWPHTRLPEGLTADRVTIYKSQRRMVLVQEDRILSEYIVALSRNEGPKERTGDGKTPEGRYRVDARYDHDSRYHRSLHLSYPNDQDLARAKALGVDPGGGISIHGIREEFRFVGRLHRLFNWTRGCIAICNQEIEDVWRAVPDHTPVHILP
jgi:murein L,D-transpeptidase YafK